MNISRQQKKICVFVGVVMGFDLALSLVKTALSDYNAARENLYKPLVASD